MPYVPEIYRGEDNLEDFRRFVEQELVALARELTETTALDLRPIHAPPLRPREGMIVCADGTNWDPGGGKGIYAFLDGSWSKLNAVG